MIEESCADFTRLLEACSDTRLAAMLQYLVRSVQLPSHSAPGFNRSLFLDMCGFMAMDMTSRYFAESRVKKPTSRLDKLAAREQLDATKRKRELEDELTRQQDDLLAKFSRGSS